MSNQPVPTVLLLLTSFLLLVHCREVPRSDFYEADGILSIDPAVYSSGRNWTTINYMNSRGLISRVNHPESSFSLNYTFYISNPGYYSFWYLSPERNGERSSDFLNLRVTDPDGFLIDQFEAGSAGGKRLRWNRLIDSDDEPGTLHFPEEGQYSLSISSGGVDSIQIHKIHMSYEDYNQPHGAGLPPSLSREFNAEEINREQPVMLPPRWAFGVILGTDQQRDDFLRFLRQLADEQMYTDAVWMTGENNSSNLTGDYLATGQGTDFPVIGINVLNQDACGSGSIDYFKKGYEFVKINETVDTECLDKIFSEQIMEFDDLERGVVFKTIGNLHHPRSGEFPLPTTSEYAFNWTGDIDVNGNNYSPGGLRELVEDLSNPGFSLYGTPYLSHPVDFSPGVATGEDLDKDLFFQYLQVLSFTPVMQLINIQTAAAKINDDTIFNENERRRLQEIFTLRKRLFPYHYSHAHETRQVNESIIEGSRNRPYQYLYGDSFLVAPITEAEENGRVVQFPGDRFWYDYRTGERYEAGQSWYIEVSPDETPLFVKAGSVIPYLPEEVKSLELVTDEYLKVEIYTGDAGTFRLVEDDGYSRDYRRAIAARTMFRYNEVSGQLKLTIGAVQKYFEGMHSSRSYDLHFLYADMPAEITINGSAVPRDNQNARSFWSYDDQESELIVTIKEQPKDQKLDILITPSSQELE